MLYRTARTIVDGMGYQESTSADDAPSRDEERDDHPERRDHPKRRRRVRTILLGLLAAYVIVALIIAWSRWGQLDPELGSSAREQAGIQLSPDEHPWYFPMLLLHIAGASIAMTAAVFQIWPWLRRNHSGVHRTIGRVYVFAGVYPAVFFAIIVQIFWPFSITTMFSQVFPAVLWAFFSTYGVVLRRQGRLAEHRRMMLRSFCLSILVLVEITIDPFIQAAILTQLHTRLNGNIDVYFQLKDSTENWVGLFIIFFIVEAWLERHPRPSPLDRFPHLERQKPAVTKPREPVAGA